MTVTKHDLVERIAARTGYPKNATARFLSAFVAEIDAALLGGERVVVSNLGTWELVERGARPARGFAGEQAARCIVKYRLPRKFRGPAQPTGPQDE